jgi:hypothetical protein
MKAVRGHSGWVRNDQGAIININGNEMAQARKRKSIWRQQQEELKTLKSDMEQMKHVLNILLEDKNGNNNTTI